MEYPCNLRKRHRLQFWLCRGSQPSHRTSHGRIWDRGHPGTLGKRGQPSCSHQSSWGLRLESWCMKVPLSLVQIALGLFQKRSTSKFISRWTSCPRQNLRLWQMSLGLFRSRGLSLCWLSPQVHRWSIRLPLAFISSYLLELLLVRRCRLPRLLGHFILRFRTQKCRHCSKMFCQLGRSIWSFCWCGSCSRTKEQQQELPYYSLVKQSLTSWAGTRTCRADQSSNITGFRSQGIWCTLRSILHPYFHWKNSYTPGTYHGHNSWEGGLVHRSRKLNGRRHRPRY